MKYVLTNFMIFCLIGSVCVARDICVHTESHVDSSSVTKYLPFKTISDIIKIAQGGDVIIILQGIYRESISVPGEQPGKPVSIIAADNVPRIVIDCNYYSTCIADQADHCLPGLREVPK